jgi:glycerol-3-phosphate acyltransferase PlsX
MDESPSTAIRQKKDSSLARSFHLVKDGSAGAMISAGNSGAVMAFGISTLGRIAEVRRPAILCHFPSKSEEGVTALLDMGANVDCTAEHLFQFAIMGHTYYQAVFDKKVPRVALLNIGEEEGKGNEVVKAAHLLLKAKLGDAYCGFVEGRDLMKGKVDVIVCDGFVGNVVLKTAEGVASMVKETLKEEFSKNPLWGLGAWLAKGGFMAMKSRLDYREYGAAPLIGLNGLGLVAHGSSDGKAISSAIRIAERYVLQGLMEKLTRSFVTAEAHLDISQVANGTKAP